MQDAITETCSNVHVPCYIANEKFNAKGVSDVYVMQFVLFLVIKDSRGVWITTLHEAWKNGLAKEGTRAMF